MSGIEFPSLPVDLTDTLRATQIGAGPAASARGRKMEQAAKDFEAVLLGKLMEEMDRTVDRSGLLDSGTTRQMQGLFWHYLSQEVANQGGLGLWKQLQRQLQAHASEPAQAAGAVQTETPDE